MIFTDHVDKCSVKDEAWIIAGRLYGHCKKVLVSVCVCALNITQQ